MNLHMTDLHPWWLVSRTGISSHLYGIIWCSPAFFFNAAIPHLFHNFEQQKGINSPLKTNSANGRRCHIIFIYNILKWIKSHISPLAALFGLGSPQIKCSILKMLFKELRKDSISSSSDLPAWAPLLSLCLEYKHTETFLLTKVKEWGHGRR